VKLVRFIFLCLVALIALVCVPAFALTFPQYQGYVNDFAGLLSADNKTYLENKLVQLEKDTAAELAVVTINSLEGSTIEEYSYKLFETWGIGKKNKNNGVLFLVAKDDRKLRIEVGYGLEPIITDGRAGRIRDNNILPYFKADDYNAGIISGVDALETLIRNGTPPNVLDDNPVKNVLDDMGPMVLLFIVTFIGSYLTGFMARSKNIWLGTIYGGLAGVVLGLAVGGIAGLIAMPVISGGFGAGLDYVLSKNYRANKSSGRSTSWHSTWGGFGSGSSGGGGGGFGGFGGGMSGGGGASGSW
jgi:uncharacterized protein